MKRKILSLGLILTMSVNLAGCAETSSPEQSGKQAPTVVTADQQSPTEPKITEPTEVQTPSSKNPQETKEKPLLEPNTSGVTPPDTPVSPQTTESGKAPAAAEPKTPAKPALPQGNISLKVGATLPEFVLTDLKGSQVSASTIITSQQLTFINFWATT